MALSMLLPKALKLDLKLGKSRGHTRFERVDDGFRPGRQPIPIMSG
jgi:hypothetical protein